MLNFQKLQGFIWLLDKLRLITSPVTKIDSISQAAIHSSGTALARSCSRLVEQTGLL